jgi:hypothetical protein
MQIYLIVRRYSQKYSIAGSRENSVRSQVERIKIEKSRKSADFAD